MLKFKIPLEFNKVASLPKFKLLVSENASYLIVFINKEKKR